MGRNDEHPLSPERSSNELRANLLHPRPPSANINITPAMELSQSRPTTPISGYMASPPSLIPYDPSPPPSVNIERECSDPGFDHSGGDFDADSEHFDVFDTTNMDARVSFSTLESTDSDMPNTETVAQTYIPGPERVEASAGLCCFQFLFEPELEDLFDRQIVHVGPYLTRATQLTFFFFKEEQN